MVVVDHGSVRTTYEPVDALAAVGDEVEAGAVIGRIGRGGHCGSSCLHWGLKRGDTYLNPLLLVGGGESVLRLLPADQRPVAQRRAAKRLAEARVAEQQVSTFAVIPAGRGGFARPVPGGITSPFGMRFHPVLHVWKLHDGTDFGAGCGTPIRAPAAGRVASVSYNAGYGNRLMLDHEIGGRRVRTGLQPRHPVRRPARHRRPARSAAGLRRHDGLLHRLSPAPDALGRRSPRQPDGDVLSDGSQDARQARGCACWKAARSRASETWV